MLELLGAFHGLDVPFVFDTFSSFGSPAVSDWAPSVSLRTLSRQMQQWWIAFAYTGDPNTGTLPQWPAVNNSGTAYMHVRSGRGRMASSSGFRAAQMHFWKTRAQPFRNSTAAAPTPAPVTPRPTPAPTVAGAPPPLAIANTMSGFTKASFSAAYQLAFRVATAATLNARLDQVTLGPITDVASRRMLGRVLSETPSIKFDTILTLTKADNTGTVYADLMARATVMAKTPKSLITAFINEQINDGVLVVAPFVNSAPPSAYDPTPSRPIPMPGMHDGSPLRIVTVWAIVALGVGVMILERIRARRSRANSYKSGLTTAPQEDNESWRSEQAGRSSTASSASSVLDIETNSL